MPFDKDPWFLAGNVQHAAEVARTMAYVACAGQEGVVGTEDLKVLATGTPSMNVQVGVGACAVQNRDTGGSYQMWTARHSTPSTVTIAAAGASPRYDMLVARIEDPYFPGSPWTNPDPTNSNPAARQAYDFAKLRIISNVPASARTLADTGLSQSALPLALITVPANATSIQQTNIIDLRRTMNAAAAAAAGDPVGVIKMYAGDIIPEGWLVCDGATFDATLYPTLAGVVGTKYGPASGNNRTLPDFRRRSPQGLGPAISLGTSDGKADPMARSQYWSWTHNHSVPDHVHAHNLSVDTKTMDKADNTATVSGNGGRDRLTGPTNHSHGLSGGVGGVPGGMPGTGNAFIEIMQPHLTVHFIIKAA